MEPHRDLRNWEFVRIFWTRHLKPKRKKMVTADCTIQQSISCSLVTHVSWPFLFELNLLCFFNLLLSFHWLALKNYSTLRVFDFNIATMLICFHLIFWCRRAAGCKYLISFNVECFFHQFHLGLFRILKDSFCFPKRLTSSYSLFIARFWLGPNPPHSASVVIGIKLHFD